MTGMFSAGDRILRRGAGRWEQSARARQDGGTGLGILALLGGAGGAWLAVLYVRRPVDR